LSLLFPGADAGQLASDWIDAGVALVVVTRGAAGAWAWTATHHVSAAPQEIDVVDTVGAGDTFQAALLTALAERSLLQPTALRTLTRAAVQEALQFATLAAAITCSRRGADLPRRHDLPALAR
jgi:fructokinase